MGVYIRGMEMPKEGSWKTVRIYPDGTCAIPNWQGDCTFIKDTKAVPVPPHGRLIDTSAKVLTQLYDDEHETWSDDVELTVEQYLGYCFNEVPTIIPAEEEEA